MQGVVKWFQASKGFGFIGRDDEQPDVFVHHSGIKMAGYRELKQGQRVQFDVEVGPKGKPQAIDVVVVGE